MGWLELEDSKVRTRLVLEYCLKISRVAEVKSYEGGAKTRGLWVYALGSQKDGFLGLIGEVGSIKEKVSK